MTSTDIFSINMSTLPTGSPIDYLAIAAAHGLYSDKGAVAYSKLCSFMKPRYAAALVQARAYGEVYPRLATTSELAAGDTFVYLPDGHTYTMLYSGSMGMYASKEGSALTFRIVASNALYAVVTGHTEPVQSAAEFEADELKRREKQAQYRKQIDNDGENDDWRPDRDAPQSLSADVDKWWW